MKAVSLIPKIHGRHALRGVALLLLALFIAAAPALAQDDIRRVVPESEMQIKLSYSSVVKATAPAVVNIYASRTVQTRSPLFSDPFFRRFFGDGSRFGVPQERVERSLGSGVLIRENGLIITNNHVAGNADAIRVVLADRREFEAEVLLADARTDLAVLKIDVGDERLPYLELADSNFLEVGDIVLAIGNPLGLEQTVTSGIISATARTQVGANNYQYFIQTDASINPGNSGGALVDLSSRLVGINTLILSQSGGSQGIGFAIPSNMVSAILDAVVEDGEIIRPWVGASGQAVTSDLAASLGLERPGGVLINDIYPGGPVDRAGIRPGDVILRVDDFEVLDAQALRFRIATTNSDIPVSFLIYRDGERVDIPVRLTLPPELPARDLTLLEGRNPFQAVTVANLSPRYADQLGFDPMRVGVIVVEMDGRSPAARRNFVRPGDIILSLNGDRIELVSDLVESLAEDDKEWIYKLRRGNQEIECGVVSRSFYCR